ncbi:helix-turn-helix domain-containing protein [Nocardiopsis alborubida]|uniref:Helix-turn-helix domain-containing protein n=1 Tax=Nocardiopsis alborubida TaxID=146802 RepID=A0A7X6RTJ2_9ACTN|nr:helix-turn-helix transcriptional regulator [Nocardiopsis alborubida]NKZ01337.1 helix-turn-helix domain-containing protein [Nocardiopsis alborubida]
MHHPISPTVRRRRLARELRRLREDRGLKLSVAAKEASVPQSTLSNIEAAEARRIKPRDIDALADLYEASANVRAALQDLAQESKEKGWWSKYRDVFGGNALPDFEVEASMMRSFECQVVPGLLQTPEYAKAVFQGGGAYTDEEVRRNVDARIQRQHVLSRHNPPHLWTVIDEAALHRQPGGTETMRGQLQHLLHMAMRHNVVIQVLPFSAGMHAALSGSFVLLDFPSEPDPSIVYTETSTDSLFVQESASLQRYVTVFSHLNASALRPSESVQFLQQILESNEQHVHE